MNSQTTLSTTSRMSRRGHSRAILVLGLPLIGGHLGQIAIGATDTIMLGWYGVAELAAQTIAGSYFFVLFIFGAGFAFAVMPLVAQFDALDDQTSLRRATRMGLWLSMGFALLVLPLLLFAAPLLQAAGQTEEVSALAGEYLAVAGWGIFPALLVMVLKNYLAALERTQIVLWITLAAAVVNGFANYALIFGNWGAPELGITGAALASVVTQLVSLVLVVIYVLRVLPEHAIFRRLWVADFEMLKRVFRLGLPIGLTVLSETGLFAASAVMMGWLGTLTLAAHGIAMQMAAITFMVHLGLSNVATIRSGNAFGRRDRAHMARGAGVVTVMSVVFSALTVIVFIGMPEPLIELFLREDETARDEILRIGIGLLAVAALFQLVDGLQAIALGLLRGVQDTAVPMILAAFSYWAIGIPCSYPFGFTLGGGGVGVWGGLMVGLIAAASALSWRFWRVTLPRLDGGAEAHPS